MTESEARNLLPELSNSDPRKRRAAALQLGCPGWSFALPELMRLAKYDADNGVRLAAIEALSKIDDRTAYAILESIWKDPAEPQDIRSEAMRACDRLDGLDDEGGQEAGDIADTAPRQDKLPG